MAAAFGVKLVSLDELCEQADFVSVHCPLNDSTRGLIGKAQFDMMKQGSYLINTARGMDSKRLSSSSILRHAKSLLEFWVRVLKSW